MAGFPGYRFKSLNARITVLLLIPVSVILIAGGILTFVFTRNLMLDQWNESAVLKLSRAAHEIEMRLTAPVKLINALFGKDAAFNGNGDDVALLLKSFEGILDARFIPDPSWQGRGIVRHGHRAAMGFHGSRISAVSDPEYDATLDGKVVTLAMELLDKAQNPMGVLRVRIGFDYLLEDVATQGWWHSLRACLVTREGIYLAHGERQNAGPHVMGETGDALEKRIVERIAAQPFGTVTSQEHPPETIAGFYTLDPVPWVLVLFARGDVVLRPIILYRNVFFAGSILMVFLILMLIRDHTSRVVREIQTLSSAAVDVAKGEYGPPIPVHGRDEISRLVQSYNTMIEGLRERDFIRDSFGRYVDPGFARQLLSGPEKSRLGGERRKVVILMSDLRGFTAMSETLSPELIIEVLNRYFSVMIRIIQSCQGIIVDFFGDAVLVFFDPLDRPVAVAAEKAMACASAMQRGMAEVNQDLARRGLPELFMGIGVHAGQVVVGSIGSDARAKYGIVGSAVNVTSRIQAESAPGEILVSSEFICLLPIPVKISRAFEQPLKGISAPVTLHSIDLT